MVTFEDLIDGTLQALQSGQIGIDPTRIVFGGGDFQPPSIQVAVYPIDSPGPSESRAKLRAEIDCFIHSEGLASEKEAIERAVNYARAVRTAVFGKWPLARRGAIQVATVIDDSGRVVHADRTVLLVSFEVPYDV